MAEKSRINPRGKPGDYVYGLLNSIKKPDIGDSLSAYGTDFYSLMSSTAKKVWGRDVDTIKDTGPYRGVVLRVEPAVSSKSNKISESDDASYYVYDREINGGDIPQLVRIKVRIPEIHAHLPVPEKWGDQGKRTDSHQEIIDYYPTFIGQSDLVPEPAVGDIVWVDFTNKNDFTDPIYIRPVLEKKHFIKLIEEIAEDVFARCYETDARSDVIDETPPKDYPAYSGTPPKARDTKSGRGRFAVGAWVMITPGGRSADRWAKEIVGSGITYPNIIANTNIAKPTNENRGWMSSAYWNSGGSFNRLHSAIKALRDAGATQVGYTYWVEARKSRITDTADDIEQLVKSAAGDENLLPNFITLNAEEGWYKKYGNAGVELAGYMQNALGSALKDAKNIYVDVTVQPSLKPGFHKASEELIKLPIVRTVTPMAYTQYQQAKKWTHNKFFRPDNPDNVIKKSYEDSARLKGGNLDTIRLGLAAQGQDFPGPEGPKGAEAMRMAAKQAAGYDQVNVVCYWSWRNIKADKDKMEFLRRVSTGAEPLK